MMTNGDLHLLDVAHLLLVACDQSYGGRALRIGEQTLEPYADPPLGSLFVPPYAANFSAWTVAFTHEDSETGLKAVLYRNNEAREIIVAFAGSDGNDLRDWWGNTTHYGWNQWKENRVVILQAIDNLSAQLQGPDGTQPRIHFTGQSLGGALAQYAAYEFAETHELSFAAERLSLVTFNGLGGVAALQEEIPKRGPLSELGYPGFVDSVFNPQRAQLFGLVAHFGSANDLVWRLGDGHLGDSVYKYEGLDFGALNPASNLPFYLDTISAHRIESGFYYTLTQFHNAGVSGFLDAIAEGPLSSGQLSESYLDLGSLQKLMSVLGNVFQESSTTNSGALVKLLFGGFGSLALGDGDEINGLIKAYVETRYRAGKYLGKEEEYEAAKETDWALRLRIGAAALGAPLGWTPYGAVIKLVGAIALAPFYSLIEGISNDDAEFALREKFGVEREGSPLPDASFQESLARSAFVGAGLGIVEAGELPLTTVAELVSGDIDGFADVLAKENDWYSATARYLVDRAGSLGEPGKAQAALNEFWAYSRHSAEGNPTLVANVADQFRDFLGEWAVAVGNVNDELVARGDTDIDVEGATTYKAKRSLWDSVLAGLEGVLDLFVGTAHAGETRTFVEEAIADVRERAQRLFVEPGRQENPFDDDSFDPSAAGIRSVQLQEGSFASFTVYLQYQAPPSGQKVRLKLAGAGWDELAVVKGDEAVPVDADGTFTVVVAEGQREATFAILSMGDPDSGGTLTLSATLLDEAGDTTHRSSDQASIVLSAEAETPPFAVREVRGDWAPREYADPSTGETYYQWDDLANIERLPGVPNTTGYEEPDNLLQGSAGNDHVVTGDFEDVVFSYEGDDHIEGGNTWGTIILAGAGDDWVEAHLYTNHAADYWEFERNGRLIKLGEDQIYGGPGHDRLYGESEASVDSLYDASVAATGRPGDWISGGSGDDEVYGGAGDDVLMGGIGQDRLVGGAGMDVLLGDDHFGLAGHGNFWTVVHPNFGDRTPGFGNFELGLFPVFNYYPSLSNPLGIDPNVQDPFVSYYKDGGGKDVLIGGAGKDILIGQLGDDELYGGEDDDVLAGWEGDDQIFGGAGDDLIAGEFGRYEEPLQRLLPEADLAVPGLVGAPVFLGSPVDQTGNDLLDGGAGNDEIFGEGGDDVVIGDDGTDVLYGDAIYLPEELHGNDLLDGGRGDDNLYGGAGNDRLIGGEGNDYLAGEQGDDVLEGGSGTDYLEGGEGKDTLLGGEGSDFLSGGSDDDQLRGGADNDELHGNAGSDVLFGDAGGDVLNGEDGDDLLEGGAGDDDLSGDDGDDILVGGPGNDVLRGGFGNDTYRFSLGDGHDYIDEREGRESLVLRFGAGIQPGEVTAHVTSDGTLLTLRYGASGDAVSVDLAHLSSIAAVEFANGTVWSNATLTNRIPRLDKTGSDSVDVLQGNAFVGNSLIGLGGDDELSGARHGDTLAGGDGNDLLEGNAGSDRYVFTAGESGVDLISDSGTATEAYLSWFYSSRGVDDWQESAEFGGRYRVQVNLDGRSRRFYFDTYEEAEPWSDLGGVIEYVEPLVEDVPLIGRSDTQTLDALSSAGLLDVDLVEFGPGVKFDDLQMSLIVPGKIALEHPEKPWTNGGLLSVRWGAAGFDVEVPSETYGFSGTKLGADELLSGAWQDYRLGEGIEGFLFADKTVVRLEEILAHATIVPARQLVSRGAGVLYFDAEAYAGIQFDNDIRADEVRITRDGADLRVTLTDGTTSILVPGWFSNPPQVPNVSIHFALDPTLAPEDITRTALTLRGTPLADFLQGVDGFPNAIYGEDGADRLLGGTGDDWIEGGDGFDQITGGGGNDRLDGGGFADSIDGESGNDLVIGANGDDRLSGGEGNDILDGGEGEDYLTGGPGDDVYVFGHGYGSDFVFDLEEMAEGGGAETIRFGSGVTPTDVRVTRDRADLIVQLNEGSDALTINAWFTEAGGQIENFVFEDGTVWHAGDVEALLPPREQATEGDDALLGTTGADVLIGLGGSDNLEGFAGDDVLQGGPGADYMGGGRGDDVYHFQPGDGADEIWDEGGYDRLVFGAGILPADIQISRDPYSLFLTVGQGGDALSILDWVYGPTSRIEALEFADGTVWGEADIWSRFPAFVPSEGADLVLGSQLDDDLFGLGANDELWGYEGNDLLHGGEGDDYLVGGTGRNLVEGGSGNDTIAEETFAGINLVIGGAGDDEIYQDHAPAVLAFNAGDGNDYVSTVAGQPLVISLGGVSVEEIELRREPGALIMQIAPGDSLMLGGYTPGGNWPSGTLQIVGEDVRAYDLNAVARSFYDAQKDALPWDASIASSEHLLWASETHAIGGAIAYQYATTGSTEALSKAQKADVIGDPSFAVAPQPIAAPPANQSPLVELPLTEQHAAEDRPFTFVIPGNTFSDPDGGPLAYHVALSSGEPLPTWLSFDPETRMLAGTPAQADVAALEITVTATDSEGLSASSTFTLTVEESNDAPVAAAPIAAQSASEDVLFWLPIPADAFFDEDPGDTLTYEASLADGSPLPGWLAFDGIALSGTPGEGDAGVRMVQLRATDAAGATASQEFELIVRAVNDAPVVLTPIADRSFEAGSPFSFSIPVGTFADEDIGDSLSLSASAYGGGSLPGWLSFDATTATFSGAPAASDMGIWHLQVVATDNEGASAASDFGLVVHAVAGASVTGGSGSDVIYGGAGDETLTAKGGDDALFGGSGNDLLKGGAGHDVLQGGEGADVLRGGSGQNVLDGGVGDDIIFGGKGSALIVGGAGNDTIRTGSGRDVILFNRGDGTDTVIADREGNNTLSLGGGIRYEDLSLAREGKDLIVDAGGTDRLVLKNWYAGKKSVANLQIVLDAGEDYDAAAGDLLFNRRVQAFDFLGLVSAFDAAHASSPGLTSWQVTNALLQFHLSGTDDFAMGGDLAYWYARNRSLSGISLAAAQQIIGAPGFGAEAQALRPFAGLQEGFVKLA